MKKAPSIVIDEPTARRLKFVSLLAGNAGVLPQDVVDKFVTNEGRNEIPERLIKGFCEEEPVVTVQNEATVGKPQSASRPRIEILHETPKPCIKRSVDEQIAGMAMMYNQLGWTFTTSGLVVPERRKGFDRLLLVGKTLTNNIAYDVCDASFPSWRYCDNFDATIPANERHPSKDGTYAVWFRDRIEADEELKSLSADMIEAREPKIKTITVLERELFELVNFMETGKHLDIDNWTLCSGSRSSGGLVPNARWCGGRFEVDWNYCYRRLPNMRFREAVTL